MQHHGRQHPTLAGHHEAPPWVAPFLAGLMVTGSVRAAVADAGIDFDAAWVLRKAEPAFAMYWDKALCVHRLVMAGTSFADAVAAEEASTH